MGHPLKRFHVSLHEEAGDKLRLTFQCQAEDEEHAEEQAANAYPNGKILLAREVKAAEWVD